MALIQDGGSQSGFADVDSFFSSLQRSTPLPANHFRAAFKTTSLAFTTGVNIASFVNPGASPIVITKLRARVKPMAIFTPAAAGLEVTLSWFIGRSWTVVGTTNRTTLSFAGNSNKLRTSFAASAQANFGYASAVGGITGDTVTQDANPIENASGSPQQHSITAAASPGAGSQSNLDCDAQFTCNVGDGEYPIVLAQNEGVRLVYTLTGTAAAIIITGAVQWAEASAFPRGS